MDGFRIHLNFWDVWGPKAGTVIHIASSILLHKRFVATFKHTVVRAFNHLGPHNFFWVNIGVVGLKPLLLSQSISWPFLCIERPIDGVRPKPLELLFLTNELRDRNDFRKKIGRAHV